MNGAISILVPLLDLTNGQLKEYGSVIAPPL